MVIELNEDERLALLGAAKVGFLDTWKIQRVADEIRDCAPFFGLLAEANDEREDEKQAVLDNWLEIEVELKKRKQPRQLEIDFLCASTIKTRII